MKRSHEPNEETKEMAMIPTGTEIPIGFVLEAGAGIESRPLARVLTKKSQKSMTMSQARERFERMFPKEQLVLSKNGAVWDRGSCLALASSSCVFCRGTGVCNAHRGKVAVIGEKKVCECVLRACFRECFVRYIACKERQENGSSWIEREVGGIQYSRKSEEYIADFETVSKRTLRSREKQLGIFNLHFIEGRDWKYCTAKLGLTKGDFFHTLYLVQERLGAEFHELEPYALHPVDMYFGSRTLNPTQHMDDEERKNLENKIKEVSSSMKKSKTYGPQQYKLRRVVEKRHKRHSDPAAWDRK